MCLKCGCRLKYKNGVPIVSCCLKNFLFVANFLTWLVSLLMLVGGCYAKIDKSYSSYGVSSLPFDPVNPILVIGSLMFFVTFFGCVGALRENICMLNFFSYALLTAFALEMLTAFIAVAMSDSVHGGIEELMQKSIKHYRDDPDLQDIIDWGQEYFHCCGVNSVHDWSRNAYFNCSDGNPSREACGVPYSCCSPPEDFVLNTLCGMEVQAMDEDDIRDVYTYGCLENFVSWLHAYLFFFTLLIAFICCIPQILGILFSRILILQIKDQDFYIKIGLLNSRGEFDMNPFS